MSCVGDMSITLDVYLPIYLFCIKQTLKVILDLKKFNDQVRQMTKYYEHLFTLALWLNIGVMYLMVFI